MRSSIALLIWSIMLVVALGAIGLLAAGRLASSWLERERAVALEIEEDHRLLSTLTQTVELWSESALSAVDQRGPAVDDVLGTVGELAHEILAQVGQLAERALFEPNQDRLAELVAHAGRVADLLEHRTVSQPVLSAEITRSREILDQLMRESDERRVVARARVRQLEITIGRMLSGGGGVYLILVILLMRWTRRALVEPIHQLRSSALELLQGDQHPLGLVNSAAREIRELSATLASLVEKLSEAQHRAEAADHAKSVFLANVSHEIRTPMSAILGYAEELEEELRVGRIPEAQREALAAIRHSGRHLLRILDDVLDLSKIEAGKLGLERIRVSPLALVSEVHELMRGRAREAGLDLLVELPPELPAWIETDPTRVRQILLNLTGNALKFTERGSVRIAVRWCEGPEASIEFTVIDTGIGMTADQLEHVFEPFSQADASTSRLYGGTGLGLTICERLARSLGGSIEAESHPGSGSSFRVILPVDAAAQVQPVTALSSGLESGAPDSSAEIRLACRILLVEDVPPLARLVAAMLRRSGASVEVVENGRVALERIFGPDAAPPPDVIVMDMQMPVLDGYEATQILRNRGYGGPIVALTAWGQPEDRQACLTAGCNEVVIKPVDRRTLVNSVAGHLNRRAAHG